MPIRSDVPFDEKAANDYFLSTEGYPYGFYNFLFGWIDTPYDNFPPLLDAHFVPIVFGVLSKIAPKMADEYYG